MLISLLLIAVAAVGGFALSYLFDEEAPFMWRLAVGNIVGCAVFGTAGFVLALLFGVNAAVAASALVIAASPAVLFYRKDYRSKFERDWSRAKGKLQGFNTRKFLRFAFFPITLRG